MQVPKNQQSGPEHQRQEHNESYSQFLKCGGCSHVRTAHCPDHQIRAQRYGVNEEDLTSRIKSSGFLLLGEKGTFVQGSDPVNFVFRIVSLYAVVSRKAVRKKLASW